METPTDSFTTFTAFPLDKLDEVKEKGLEYKVVHLVRHAQGASLAPARAEFRGSPAGPRARSARRRV